VDRVLLDAADGFRLDPARVPDDADLVVLGNPTNPTSVLHPAALVRRLARPGRTLVVDEAFMDAVPGERESLAGGPAGGDVPGLVVLRSLTKTWGLAGLRVGYLLAGADLVAALRDAQPLWAVSTPALVAAEACMAPEALAEAAEAARTVTADRAYLMERLRAVPEVRVAGDTPVGPFLLLHVPGAADVRSRLRESGYAVRRADTFPGLGPDWLRVAVRDRRTTDGFANALAMATVALPGLPAPASPAGGPGSPSGPAAPPGPAASPTSPDVPRTPEPADSPGDPRSPGAAHSPGRPSARPRPPVLPG
jgi:histidinol-phosphate aminotransferase